MIKDEFTRLIGSVSRQRIWQLRKNKKGLCAICGKSRAFTKTQCLKCAKKDVLRAKRKYKGGHTKRITAYDPYGKRAS